VEGAMEESGLASGMGTSTGGRKLGVGREIRDGDKVMTGSDEVAAVESEEMEEVKDDNGPPPKKKLRIETNITITYDHTGTPVFTPLTKSFAAAQLHSAIPSTSNLATTPSLANLSLLTPNLPTDRAATTPATPTTPGTRKPVPRNPDGTFPLISALARDDSLLLKFVSYLPFPALITLYATSKTFHYLFNRNHTAYILSSTRTWAPNSEKIYPWRCYKSLCVKDPGRVQKMRLDGKEAEVKKRWQDLRDCPSLRWLQMVVWRMGVCEDMLIVLRTYGLYCPPGTLEAVRRMWFLMDLPLNAHRIALVRNEKYFSNDNLRNFNHFLIKVDMFFTDPTAPQQEVGASNRRLWPEKHDTKAICGVDMRKMLLQGRQMTSLWRVIRGWSPDPEDGFRGITDLDVLRLWVRHEYRHPEDTPEETRKMSIMGIPWWEVGMAGMERTGVAFGVKKDDGSAGQEGGGGKGKSKQVAISHPSIVGNNLAPAQQAQLQAQQPQQPSITLPHTKPREPLLGPDELLVKECFRRGMKMHKEWLKMATWGFVGLDGWTALPISEEETWRRYRGLEPKDRGDIESKERFMKAWRGRTDDEGAIGVQQEGEAKGGDEWMTQT